MEGSRFEIFATYFGVKWGDIEVDLLLCDTFIIWVF